jgi:hypothetical protein
MAQDIRIVTSVHGTVRLSPAERGAGGPPTVLVHERTQVLS